MNLYNINNKTTKEKMKKKRTTMKRKNDSGGGIFDFFKSNKNGNGKMNYTLVSISYNGGKNIQCDVCQQIEFYKINVSIDRSKTADLASNFLLGSEFQDVVSHPVKMYVCTKCHNCKFVYSPTTWNGLKDTIIEQTSVGSVTNPLQQAPVQATAQAPVQAPA